MMLRAKSLLDEILGEATGKQFSPVIQPAPAQPAPAQPAPAPTPAPALRPWFADPNAGWSYYSEAMTGPHESLGAPNLASLVRDKAKALGYSGGGMWGDTADFVSPGGDQPGVRTVNPDFQNWLTSNNYQLGGESVGINGIGGVNAFITDSTGKRISEQSYASDDSDFFNFGVGLLGLGAFSAVNAGVGAASGVGNGAFLGEGVASGIPAWDAAVGIGAEMAALPASQIGAMTPTLESMLPSVADAAAWESALPGMTPGMTVGGTVVDAALPSLASVAGSEAALPGMTPGMTVGGSIVESALPSVASVAASESALPGMIPGTTVGNPLNGLLGAAGGAADWLKANPIMGRLLMSGAGALVSGLGGSGGGSAAPTNYGPAKQWTSPIQSGLLSAPRNVQQVQPGGLLGGPGVANSGAWQWRK